MRLTVPRGDLESARSATLVQGDGLAAAIRRHPLGAYFVLSYVFSWYYWVPVALAGGGVSHFPGLLGPMLAALTVTFVALGRAGARRLLQRMFRRVALRWYVTALVPAAAGLAAIVLPALAGAGWPTLQDLSTMPGLPTAGFLVVLAMVLMINGYGEEVGWRGFAWSRLRQRHTLAGAAVLLGVVWAGWHLPAFWIDTGMRDLGLYVIPGWIIGLVAGSVVLGWLYERAGARLLIVAIFHTFLNMASATPATEGLPAAITAATVIVWAILILRWERLRS